MRRTALTVLLAATLSLTGCLGGQPATTPASETVPSSGSPTGSNAVSTPTPPGECPDDVDAPAYPDPPESFSGVAAKEVALDSERAHVYRELCQRLYDDIGLGGGISYPEATVLRYNDSVAVVQARIPYTYGDTTVPPDASTPPGGGTPTPIGVEGDDVSYGVYRITETSVERLRDGGPRE